MAGWWAGLVLLVAVADPVRVAVPLVGSEPAGVNLGELVARLAEGTGVDVARPPGEVVLPVTGTTGALGRSLLTSTLGPGAPFRVEGKALVVDVSPDLLTGAGRPGWAGRLRDLATQAEREARRRLRYGMHARRSYRPNDPSRPTVCLVHGMNSSSGGFVHTIPPIEEAGYGVVVYDYPFNRSLEESCARFARDWKTFREETGEKQPWALVAHSMGSLVTRDYVEGPAYAGDVSTLILIAPPNQGSSLAKTQTLLQLLNGAQAVGGPRPSTNALAHLGDGLGQAATDMLPGSAFLKALNARPRREGVPYHILAGDLGFLPRATRQQIESQVGAARKRGGILGGLTRLATGDDLSDRLAEVSDGSGDGCVSVARSRLDGVSDHVTIHANHAELVRAPLLFADPGPVACMPYLLRWLPKPAAPGPAAGR